MGQSTLSSPKYQELLGHVALLIHIFASTPVGYLLVFPRLSDVQRLIQRAVSPTRTHIPYDFSPCCTTQLRTNGTQDGRLEQLGSRGGVQGSQAFANRFTLLMHYQFKPFSAV